MPLHSRHEPLRTGFTLPEVVIGIALVVLVSLVSARLLMALARGSRYLARQSSTLAEVRKSLFNEGTPPGMLWSAAQASAVTALSTATLSLTMAGPATLAYSTTTAGLIVYDGVTVSTVGKGISALNVSYYEIGSNGLIFQSTVAAQASLAFFTLTVSSGAPRERPYSFVTAAWMRNR